MVDFRFYLIGDRSRCAGRSLASALGQACRAGVRAFQIREKDLNTSDLLALTGEVKAELESLEPVLVVNGNLEVAAACGAQGVHLPESGVPVREAREALPAGILIGRSTHGTESARAAEAEGADFVTFGPVYDTPSKAGYGPPQGIRALAEAAGSVTIPVFALGGVTPGRTRACLEAGASGVAAISAVLSQPDIPAAVRKFEKALGGL
ncbi:MAG: thiamine phosphate synthase [Gemmatimonadetes bacterium]|nr:thiamine phosphate synthase [Gemmatimonadota bacterium]MYB60948.1 thiamine phosphate synthase [Gemmatimonadota bacterium]